VAIDWLRTQTGRPVTIVAHSFGGVLVRTALQGQGLRNTAARLSVAAKVAQVVTLGTPHGGIRSAPGVVAGVDLPGGIDLPVASDLIKHCGQISCHQAGQPSLDDAAAALLLDDATPGALIARLADSRAEALPAEVPFLVGIGLGVADGRVSDGDGLISFQGQRFDASVASLPSPLLDCQRVRGALVREVALAAGGALPGETPAGDGRGLVHTAGLGLAFALGQQDREADVPADADHPSLREIRAVLASGVCPPTRIALERKSRLANCARPCVLAATADGRLFGAGTDPDADGMHPLGSPGVAAGPWFPLSSSLPAVRAVSSGSGSSMLAGTDGSLWVTGNGSFGRLGDGAIGSDTWKPVGGIHDVRAVVGRGIASYAITGRGQLWMAGANTEGQAGYLLPPGQVFVTSWARVPTIPDALRVDSNGIHTLVLRSDRTVWAAGQNSRGSESMLGFGAGGSVLNIREWRQVSGLANIVDIATGASHSLALTEGGRIWAVGDAPSGTFSSFGWTPQLAFAEVPGIADVQSIVAGDFCSMAIKIDGSLWVAGLFGVGATGAGAGAPINFAAWTRISAAPPLSAVQTDCARSLAIGRDGKLYVTGANELGGIGLGNPQTTAGVPRETLVWTPIESLGTGF
jgi:alpha-tubulin suppressor-like RCC1 family protein